MRSDMLPACLSGVVFRPGTRFRADTSIACGQAQPSARALTIPCQATAAPSLNSFSTRGLPLAISFSPSWASQSHRPVPVPRVVPEGLGVSWHSLGRFGPRCLWWGTPCLRGWLACLSTGAVRGRWRADGVCCARGLEGIWGCSGPRLPGPNLLLRPGWSPPPLLGQALQEPRGDGGGGSSSCQRLCDSALEMGSGQGLRGPRGDGREWESCSTRLLCCCGLLAGAQGDTCLAAVLSAASWPCLVLLSLLVPRQDTAGRLQPISRAVLAVLAGMTMALAPCTGPAVRAAPMWSTCSSCGEHAST